MKEQQSLTFGRLNECTFEEALLLRNRGFEQYFSNMTTTMEGLLRHLSFFAIRPDLSVVAYTEGKAIGFVFLAMKQIGGRLLAWNGGTGVLPEFRGRGVAKAMMRESERILEEQRTDMSVLEVITENEPAITAYRHAGFRIADRLISLNREGNWAQDPYAIPADGGWEAGETEPAVLRKLPFYSEMSAWECQWHHFRKHQCLILYDPSGEPAGYALFDRICDAEGEMSSVALYQCTAAPERIDRIPVFQRILSAVFGPWDSSCRRTVENLSMSDPELINLLVRAGFHTRYEQYLMIRGSI